MNGEESSWRMYNYNTGWELARSDTISDYTDENDNVEKVSMDSILPDDLLERIFAYLPVASIFRAGSVCKRWCEIVNSRRFLWNMAGISSQKPWYFMFTDRDNPDGYAYDSTLRKWYSFQLPYLESSNWFISSSFGLVCYMDNGIQSLLFVCNPITNDCKQLEEPPSLQSSDYSALSLSVDRESHCYTVTVVRSKHVPSGFREWDLSIQVYSSENKSWITSINEEITGWRSGEESVICDGILYFLIYSTGGGGGVGLGNRHALITYDLSRRPSQSSLMRTLIPVPNPLTCGRLMNLKDKLVMVGGIGKHDRSDIIKGIGIWILEHKVWHEVTRMPHKFFQGFGEFDEVFASSGTNDLIYIQSYGAPALLVFDMNHKQWKWSQKCPVTKRFPLQLFSGFCFEPRLEVSP